jgi:hypothetical protein
MQMFQKATISATPTLASDNPPEVQLSVRSSSLLQYVLSSHVLRRVRCTLENHLPLVWRNSSTSSRPLARILKVRVNVQQHQLNLFKTLPGVMVILLTPSATLLVADARTCPYVPVDKKVSPNSLMKTIAGPEGGNCFGVCSNEGFRCDASSFDFVNSCKSLSEFFPCESGCDYNVRTSSLMRFNLSRNSSGGPRHTELRQQPQKHASFWKVLGHRCVSNVRRLALVDQTIVPLRPIMNFLFSEAK